MTDGENFNQDDQDGQEGQGEKREKGHGITEGNIVKQILIFFFPILFGTFFQQLYNTADAIVVGQFVGKEALSAVGGTTGSIINLLVGFFMGLSSGATVVVSQYFGAKQKDELHRAVHTAVALAITGGAILMVGGIAISKTALTLNGTPESVMAYSLTYMRVYFMGMIPNLVYNIGAGILRAIGDSRRPLIFLIIACVTNIVLDITFVTVFKWEVFGVAFATILSQLISAVMVVTVLIRTKEPYRLEPKKIKFDKYMLLRIFKIGLPAGFQSAMYSISNVLIQTNVNTFGTDTIAAWAALGKMDGIFWMIMGAFGISITTFVGQNYGAVKYDRIKKGVMTCMIMAFAASITLSSVMLIFGQHFFRLFVSEQSVIDNGLILLRLMAPTFSAYVCIEILSGAMRGTGDAIIPTIMTCLGVCVFRIIWLTAIAPQWNGTEVRMIVICYPLSWVLTSGLFIVYYKKFSHLSKIFKQDKIDKSRGEVS
jgi:putative efflux protein, MATE family